MPPHATPQQPAARPSPGPGPEPDREPPDRGRSQSTTPAPTPRHRDVAPRDFVRLFQCRVCSLPLREPVSLPCGKTMCRRCLPETHRRSNITYPAAPDRLRGFKCPFSDCAREHALDDCAVDVVLNKTAGHVRDEIDRRKLMVHGSTRVEWPDPWAAAGITSMREDDAYSKVIQGGKVVATYSLAEEGDLSYDTDITYSYIPSPPTSPSPTPTVDDDDDTSLIRKAQDATRAEMDCQVCYALFYDPLTTPCGHTFCRSCLHRILDHSRYCPICRRPMAINPVLSQNSSPSNETITRIIEAFWLDEVHARKEALDAERASQMQDFDLPLFVCTLSFPLMPTFLHIFEPRYRLMIRRALEGDRTFGMVLPKRPQHPDDVDFHDLGTLLRIVNIQYYPDGRSLIETVGISRFRVRNHSYIDGYTVAKIERVDDVSLEQEEAMEAMEAVPPTEQSSTGQDSSIQGDKDSQDSPSSASPPPAIDSLPMPASPEDIDAMSTQSLMQFASSFVARMRVQSVPWLTERMLAIYGECPDDAAIFPWWFASMLPVKDLEKYRLLGTSSVRERLKICCSWIIEWQTSRWTKLIDGRSGLSTAVQSSD
ncbi:hypothetical protein LCI18_005354 [Fusarium solani-melongenae]|uniref:Uncharacterized protein n=1 Tax=Fusarium solani subsp. cucurbitae TaxID=2747967 RepID=A0ACD3YZK4_FUSSC|nr:hypothetical protein LCI18_005354 [Fusarium solani-melongenae]